MKPDFKDIYYDPATIRFPIGGNKIGALQLLARIPLREKTKKELKAEKEDYLRAKEIYDAHINKGQKFKAIGEDTKVIAKITYINAERQTVSWKQCNIEEMRIEYKRPELKPAAGRWSINGFIAMVKSKKIEFIN